MIKIPCEVYSRVVGYLRPVQNWNEGKKQEFAERKVYNVSEGFGGGGLLASDERIEPELLAARKEHNETEPERRAALQIYAANARAE